MVQILGTSKSCTIITIYGEKMFFQDVDKICEATSGTSGKMEPPDSHRGHRAIPTSPNCVRRRIMAVESLGRPS